MRIARELEPCGGHTQLHDRSPSSQPASASPQGRHIQLHDRSPWSQPAATWLRPTAGTDTCVTAHLGVSLQPAALQRASRASDLALLPQVRDYISLRHQAAIVAPTLGTARQGGICRTAHPGAIACTRRTKADTPISHNDQSLRKLHSTLKPDLCVYVYFIRTS